MISLVPFTLDFLWANLLKFFGNQGLVPNDETIKENKKMHNKKLFIFISFLFIFSCFFIGTDIKAEQTEPLVKSLSSADRKAFREKLIGDLIEKYRENQVFDHMNEYMIGKTEELHQPSPSKLPDFLIEDTFNKTDSLFNHTKGFIGNSFVTSYEPDRFEKNVHKYLWLKGIGFWILGIGEEHKLAFSYFYLPGNESLKEDLLREIVQYSFPEIPEVAENKEWYDQMVLIMGRLGYSIFSVKRFGLAEND
jgi:hypothetical protein